MKEYESMCLEELRCEDYMSNRKGPRTEGILPTGQQATSGSFFGVAPNQTAQAMGGLFGSTWFLGLVGPLGGEATWMVSSNHASRSSSMFVI